ncbi:uncharacterized protein VTP21DRAFT_10641 [Calcarisporiella thermophila]|uniref:uncharacterized protein n=1 Tax=Calcarisporiella thermophila TaxID=911321 RepID=UPI0037433BB8
MSHRYQKLIDCPLTDRTMERRGLFEKGIKFDFRCSADSHSCEKVRKSFEKAGDILSSALHLKTPILVNASFHSFCKDLGISCKANEGLFIEASSIGLAQPVRLIPIKEHSDDAFPTLYPQALAKQLGMLPHPEYSDYDIEANFNMDYPWYFEGEGPMRADQADLTETALHELVHGLGFISSLYDFRASVDNFRESGKSSGLTPDWYYDAPASDKSPFKFRGFLQYVFDRHIAVLPDLIPLDEYINRINRFRGVGMEFHSTNDFARAFMQSSEYDVSQELLRIATTPRRLGFLPVGGKTADDALILETSLKPFQGASSISHVDLATYRGTPERLMTYLNEENLPLTESVKHYGGPLGPKLLQSLHTLGYDLAKDHDELPKLHLRRNMQPTGVPGNDFSFQSPLPSNTSSTQNSSISAGVTFLCFNLFYVSLIASLFSTLSTL